MRIKKLFQEKSFFFGLALASSVALIQNKNFLYNIESPHEEKNKTKTFLWGNGTCNINDPNTSCLNYEPKLIQTFDSSNSSGLCFLSLGKLYEAGISVNNEILIWKKQPLPAIKDTTINDHTRTIVQKITCTKKHGFIIKIGLTKNHLWALNNDGEIFQLPINIEDLQQKDFQQDLIKIEGVNLVQDFCVGSNHIAFLTKKGEVFTMGNNYHGQCGIDEHKKLDMASSKENDWNISSPVKVRGIPKIKEIACGGNHTLVVSYNRNVYGWGSNSSMQLSHEVEYSSTEKPMLKVFNPIKIEKNLENSKVTGIAAGGETSFIITENKSTYETEVFGCGKNSRGQLGIKASRQNMDLEKINNLSNFKFKSNNTDIDIKIRKIACGRNHCMALLNYNNVLLGWGENKQGQLGNSRRGYIAEPLVLDAFFSKKIDGKKIIDIACGDNTSGAIILE